MKNSSRVLVALAAGAAIGGILGILFAPDKGSATREKIADKAKDVSDNVKDYVSAGKDKLEEIKNNLEAKLDKVNQKLREKKNDYENSANSTI
jgi:gas vesicle protein